MVSHCGPKSAGFVTAPDAKPKPVLRSATAATLMETCPPAVRLPTIGGAQDSPSQPLPDTTRDLLEPRLGRSLAAVRLHTGTDAADAARQLDARAFTLGRDIYLGSGEFHPGISEGFHLIAHEAVHTLQQGWRTPPAAELRVSRPDDPAEIEAQSVASALEGGGAAPPVRAVEQTAILRKAKGKGKGKVPPKKPKPLMYDIASYTLTAPVPGTKLDQVKSDVDDATKTKPPDLKSAAVQGVQPGSEAEIFVWNILYQVGMAKRWGTEVDLVADIGWPAQGAPAPVGQVTVRIDAEGNAVAELLSRGPVTVPATFKTLDDAKKALRADFGIVNIAEENGAIWELKDLTKIHAAFSRMPAADRVQLRGIDLVRTDRVFDEDGNERAGGFSSSASVEEGGTTATRSQLIRVADQAFENEKISFVGSKTEAMTPLYRLVLHEAGHAVETKARRDAKFVDLQALALRNEKANDFNAAVDEFNGEAGPAADNFNQLSNKERKSGRAYASALQAVATASRRLADNEAARSVNRLASAVDAAVRKRNAARNKLSKQTPVHPAIANFAKTEALEDKCVEAAKAIGVATTGWREKEALTKAVSGTGSNSGRLKNFVAFVRKKKIAPFTSYARKNWPAKPQEFFAEAYSLWLTDREYLETNAKALVDWFDQGEHLK